MNLGPELLIIPFGLLFVGGFVVWIWALVDAIQVPDDSMYRSGNKLLWVLVIVLTGIIGAIIYFVVGRPVSRAAPPRAAPSPASVPRLSRLLPGAQTGRGGPTLGASARKVRIHELWT